MRIDLKLVSVLTTAAVLAIVIAPPTSAQQLTVKIAQGQLHGKSMADGNVRAFLGIPYAGSPAAENRWKPAPPAPTWPGIREATRYGSRCVPGQPSPDMVFLDTTGPSEDCLFINVYTPADATRSARLPVMFWIHGGGFFSGAGGEPRHNPDFLVPRGVILITFNYRLGILGFLSASQLAAESGGTAGNFGFMDMIAALRWTRDNISAFGGDPRNVTIFGESAGSFAVSTLIASPLARDLFQKAIGESGAAFSGSLPYEPLATRGKSDSDWIDSIGIHSLAELRALPVDRLREAALKRGLLGFPPDIDGKVLTEPIADTYNAGRQAHVPLIAGWNADEGAMFAGRGMTVDQWKQMATTLYNDRAPELLKLYPAGTDAQALRSAIDYGGDSFIAFSTWKWTEAHAKTGSSPVYRYHFELPAPESTYFKAGYAAHADEIEYVFGTLDTRPGATWRPEDRKLSLQMMEYWTNFAKTGNPNGPNLPVWPRYDRDQTILHLDSAITVGPDTARPRYEFLLKGMPAFRF